MWPPIACEVLSEKVSPTTLESLDDFSLMGILDMLYLDDLVRLAALNPRFRQLVADHYIILKFRLHEKEVLLSVAGTFSMKYKLADGSYLPITDNYDEILLVLRHFGHLFNYLDIVIFSTGHAYFEKVQFLVNEHCSDALQNLQYIIGRNGEYVPIKPVNISFPYAAEVNLEFGQRFKNIQIRLDVSFPQMKKLTANRIVGLNYTYPHLTEATLHINDKYEDLLYLGDFMKMNSQLRSVDLPVFDDESYLTTISKCLPHLESLTLRMHTLPQYSSVSFTLARFPNVKHFILDTFIPGSNWNNQFRWLYPSLEFDQLESLSVFSFRYFSQLFGMLELNASLKNLTLEVDLSFHRFALLIALLQELKEINIIWREHSSRDEWVRCLEHVIRGNHTLEKFNVHFSEKAILGYSDLLEVAPAGWNEATTNRNPALLRLQRLN